MMEREFNKKLNIHLDEWVQNSQSISWSLEGQPFFSVEEDSTITVNLMLLSESYRNKHINSQPGVYCNSFLAALRPYLIQFLIQFGVREYAFTFDFLMNGNVRKDCYVTAA